MHLDSNNNNMYIPFTDFNLLEKYVEAQMVVEHVEVYDIDNRY